MWDGPALGVSKRFALVVREAAYCRERVVCLTGEEAIPKMVDHRERLLDPIGWRLIAASRQDARLTYSELGARVGLSAPAVAERMRRLEEAGIMHGSRRRPAGRRSPRSSAATRPARGSARSPARHPRCWSVTA